MNSNNIKMGVPGFFLWLLKKYKHKNFILAKDVNITNDKINNIDELLIDANCLIHPQCFKILNENQHFADVEKLESAMINQCILYIDELIRYSKPKKLVYIAVDGVAPLAKIKQQRIRRYKAYKDTQIFNELKHKYNKEITNDWSNVVITPGTKFMEKLMFEITRYINAINWSLDIYGNNKVTVIFSPSTIPAEGEHKLLQYIRNKEENNDISLLYGLDADLIFLALSTQKKDIFLLRESDQINNQNKSNGFNFISIDIMKQCIYEEITNRMDPLLLNEKPEMNRIINDFIFICYFLGNDFIPHIPSIDISTYCNELVNGLELLISGYVNVFENYKNYIVKIEKEPITKITLDHNFLMQFITNIAASENEFLINNYNKKHKRIFCDSSDPYDIEKFKIENLLIKINDPIKLGKDYSSLWKYRYYNHYFKARTNQEEFIQKICNNYFEGLLWIAYYYFDKCPSWRWTCMYENGPLLSDLANCLKNFDFETVSFNKKQNYNEPVQPFVQLMSVVPPQLSNVLPNQCSKLMLDNTSPLIHLYPLDFELDMIHKKKYWQCTPILPLVDIALIENTIKKIELDKEDIKRNTNIHEPIII